MSAPSIYLIGIRDMEGKFKEMLEAKAFCDERGLSYPLEVANYFGDLVPETEEYIRGEMERISLVGMDGHGHCMVTGATTIRSEVGKAEMLNWFDVSLDDLPSGLRALRVMISW